LPESPEVEPQEAALQWPRDRQGLQIRWHAPAEILRWLLLAVAATAVLRIVMACWYRQLVPWSMEEAPGMQNWLDDCS
jgi:hypothetical protein